MKRIATTIWQQRPFRRDSAVGSGSSVAIARRPSHRGEGQPIRRRCSYANVAATLALVFSMSGGAMAASHYLITSTKQIKPSVLRQLRGKRGASGARGVTGPQGTSGKEGQQGPAGPFPATLPTGQTLTGVYNLEGTNSAGPGHSYAGGMISFQFRLAAAPIVHFIPAKGAPLTQCPGSVQNPQAQSGNLCIYEDESKEAEGVSVFNPSELEKEGASPFGAALSLKSTKVSGGFYSLGTWAVTG